MAFEISDLGGTRGLYKMMMEDAAARSGTKDGYRASVSNVLADGGSLRFQYTLQRQANGLWCFLKAYAILTVSYFDADRKALGEPKDVLIGVDDDFDEMRKTSMVVSVSVSAPPGAAFFSVELRGFKLATGQIVMPRTQGGQ
jgi:hypothetical protein